MTRLMLKMTVDTDTFTHLIVNSITYNYIKTVCKITNMTGMALWG